MGSWQEVRGEKYWVWEFQYWVWSSGVEVKGIEAEVYIIAGKNALVNVRGFSIRGSQGEKRFDLLLREV